jgi:hypothetical protein
MKSLQSDWLKTPQREAELKIVFTVRRIAADCKTRPCVVAVEISIPKQAAEKPGLMAKRLMADGKSGAF